MNMKKYILSIHLFIHKICFLSSEKAVLFIQYAFSLERSVFPVLKCAFSA